MNDIENTKKRMPIWGKILIAIGGLMVFFTIFFLVLDTPVVSGYRQFIRRNINTLLSDNKRSEKTEMRVMEAIEFDGLEKKLPFKIPEPAWLPENYELDYIDYTYSGDIYNIAYKYINKNDTTKYIEISIYTYVITKPEEGIVVDYEKAEVGDLEVILMTFGEPTWQAVYINEQGFKMIITTFENKETLLKIIENMS